LWNRNIKQAREPENRTIYDMIIIREYQRKTDCVHSLRGKISVLYDGLLLGKTQVLHRLDIVSNKEFIKVLVLLSPHRTS